MEQSIITEHDCNVLGGLFQIVINDLKNGTSTWEDFLMKATKFQTQLKSTIAASTAFLDSFQKVADMATTTRGGTKEIGTALTRLCLRQRSVEAKLKSFASAFLDCLIIPLQTRVDEWKKATIQLDKERTKDLKRLRQEFKKRHLCDSGVGSASGTLRSKKRLSKGKFDFLDSLNSKGIYGTIGSTGSAAANHKSSSLSRSLDSEMDCNERLLMLEDLEKQCVRRALIEERSHFCLFVRYLRPLIEEECSMIGEMSHIQEVMDSLLKLSDEPDDLPVSSEIALSHLKLNKNDSLAWNLHTPPSSPSSLGSRKSSMCSISSLNSSSNSIGGGNYQTSNNHNHQSKYHNYSPSDITSKSVYGSDYHHLYSNHQTTNNKNNDNVVMNHNNEPLQFPIESTSSDNQQNQQSTKKKNTIKIRSTNPFLSSYNQINHNDDNVDVDNNDQTSNTIISSTTTATSGNVITTTTTSYSSDGSITPTNAEHIKNTLFGSESVETASSTSNNNNNKNQNKSNKPPPAPPVRRTSSLSNPNAITLGTLKNVIINNNSNYDTTTLNSTSLYDEINVLTKSMNDINFTLKHTDFINSFGKNSSSTSINNNNNDASSTSSTTKESIKDNNNTNDDSTCPSSSTIIDTKNDYHVAKRIFENLNQNQQSQFEEHSTTNTTTNNHPLSYNNKSIDNDDVSQLPLPAPPPEAFVDSPTGTMATVPSSTTTSSTSSSMPHHHYNKITNVHREFLETLNNKLSQAPLVYGGAVVATGGAINSPASVTRIQSASKRRNSNQSIPDDYNNVVGVPGSSYTSGQTKHRQSSRSSSTSRVSSRKNSMEKNNGIHSGVGAGGFIAGISSSLNSSTSDFVDKLSQTLMLKQQQPNANELAKQAASNALQRKQSVPDLNEYGMPMSGALKNQNRVTFSSSLNLSSTASSSSSASNQAFQVVNIQTNSTQQPIYASRQQLRQEIQDLYGAFSGNSNNPFYYSSSTPSNDRSSSYYQNGFFNKL